MKDRALERAASVLLTMGADGPRQDPFQAWMQLPEIQTDEGWAVPELPPGFRPRGSHLARAAYPRSIAILRALIARQLVVVGLLLVSSAWGASGWSSASTSTPVMQAGGNDSALCAKDHRSVVCACTSPLSCSASWPASRSVQIALQPRRRTGSRALAPLRCCAPTDEGTAGRKARRKGLKWAARPVTAFRIPSYMSSAVGILAGTQRPSDFHLSRVFRLLLTCFNSL